MTGPRHEHGWYVAPTLLENVNPHDEISTVELFGPIACLYRVGGFREALELANDSPYGLTACFTPVAWPEPWSPRTRYRPVWRL